MIDSAFYHLLVLVGILIRLNKVNKDRPSIFVCEYLLASSDQDSHDYSTIDKIRILTTSKHIIFQPRYKLISSTGSDQCATIPPSVHST